MPKSLHADIERLHNASNNMLDLMDMSRREHSGHDDDLVDAVGNWNGEIASALAHVATTWTDRRAALHANVGRIGAAMSDAVVNYLSTDQNATDNIHKSGESL